MQPNQIIKNTPVPRIPSNDDLHAGLRVSDRLIKIKEVMLILSIKKTTLYAGMQKGIFPQPIRFNKRLIRWRLSEIMEIIGKAQIPIPQLPASNDELMHFDAPTSSPINTRSAKSPLLDSLEMRKRELQATGGIQQLRARIPIKRRRSAS